jgi:hypothetical protein
MATKKTTTKTKAAPKAKTEKTPKKAPKAKVEQVKTARHPKARVVEKFGDKAALAKQLAPSLARGDEKAGDVEARLKTASNSQLLRLQKTVSTVTSKWGSRDKLIAAIGTAKNKGKDKDYLAKLESYSLTQLLDLGLAGERAARA